MNFKEALRNKNSFLVIIDLFMMVLLIMNLTLIIFDWFYSIEVISQFLGAYLPVFYVFYRDNIHANFQEIDLVFVTVFLSEFMFSWAIAIFQKTYHRWFFYPFLHWYDLISCIPVDTLRFVRILRIFSILVRLQNLKIIDLTNTYVYAKLQKYYGIVVEEVSDRVVVNIIEGFQDEISKRGPVVDNIIKDVIKPKQPIIVDWISNRLAHAFQQDILSRKDDIEEYIEKVIKESMRKNSEIKTIEQLPVMGKMITETIANSISDIINNIIEKTLSDLASHKNRAFIHETTNAIINSIEYKDDESHLNEVFSDISVEVLEVIKQQVKIQKWKLKDKSEAGLDNVEKTSVDFLMKDKE